MEKENQAEEGVKLVEKGWRMTNAHREMIMWERVCDRVRGEDRLNTGEGEYMVERGGRRGEEGLTDSSASD